MDFRTLRFHVFQALIGPFSQRSRRRRMRQFCEEAGVFPGMRVLDLGGTATIWRLVDTPLDVTILNLPGSVGKPETGVHTMRAVEGDACDVPQFEDEAFDLVFSNSVIEHVGSEEKQRAFAAEVQRLGKAFWVQTPSKWFPIEAHCGMPFWWFYPERLRRYFLSRWHPGLPAWTDSIAETRVLERSHMEELFPGARLLVERAFALPKSYIAVGRSPASR